MLALGRCQESEDIDFKESANWDSLKWRITHAALGMGNLRDGGIIIVGVSERGDAWALTGVAPDHLATYEPDNVAAHVSAYISPYVDLDTVTVEHSDGNMYLAIYVREFRDTPLVCRKNGPDGTRILEGRVYVRLPAPARTTVITHAAQMHDLLELAAEKRARRLLEVGQRIGLRPQGDDAQRYSDELGGL